MAKYTTRKDGQNAASSILSNAEGAAQLNNASRAVNSLVRTGTNYASQAVQAVSNLGNTLHDASVATVNFLQNSWNTGVNAVASWLGSLGR